MKCTICYRKARGYGWSNPRLKPGHPENHLNQRLFCSRRCQDAFCKLMDKTGGQMIDPTEMEVAAMQACLAPLGEYVASIGMEQPLADYTRDEVLTLIDVIVTVYQNQMIEEHERMAARDRAFLEERLARQGQAAPKGVPF